MKVENAVDLGLSDTQYGEPRPKQAEQNTRRKAEVLV